MSTAARRVSRQSSGAVFAPYGGLPVRNTRFPHIENNIQAFTGAFNDVMSRRSFANQVEAEVNLPMPDYGQLPGASLPANRFWGQPTPGLVSTPTAHNYQGSIPQAPLAGQLAGRDDSGYTDSKGVYWPDTKTTQPAPLWQTLGVKGLNALINSQTFGLGGRIPMPGDRTTFQQAGPAATTWAGYNWLGKPMQFNPQTGQKEPILRATAVNRDRGPGGGAGAGGGGVQVSGAHPMTVGTHFGLGAGVQAAGTFEHGVEAQNISHPDVRGIITEEGHRMPHPTDEVSMRRAGLYWKQRPRELAAAQAYNASLGGGGGGGWHALARQGHGKPRAGDAAIIARINAAQRAASGGRTSPSRASSGVSRSQNYLAALARVRAKSQGG